MSKEKKSIKMETMFGNYDVMFSMDRYLADSSLYVGTFSFEEGPIATLTVCLDDKTLESNEAYIDTNNCPWAEDFLTKNGFAMPKGEWKRSGYCVYPLYAFDMDKLSEYAIG